MVALHQRALQTLEPATRSSGYAAQLNDFFRELLSPFEMTFRGYREANAELQRTNARLVQQRQTVEAVNKELESFSYSVSHDLRAPLRAITGSGQAMLEDCADRLDVQGKKHLQQIRESARHMAQLIDDLLKLARVTGSDLLWAHADLTTTARTIADRLQATAPERQVDVVIADALSAEGDVRLLAIALENLLGNAWKFTSKRERARIEFGQREEAGATVYFVRDNGAGFDTAYANRLFGAFQRLHSVAEFEGTGIGLATVQRIVHRHSGKVWADSQEGHGATFCFTLGRGSQT
jgi:light-regulated signal transduction histidine kinase (bacteriophytochrome)